MELIAGNVNALLEYIRGIMLKISDNSEHLNGSSQKIAQNLAKKRGEYHRRFRNYGGNECGNGGDKRFTGADQHLSGTGLCIH